VTLAGGFTAAFEVPFFGLGFGNNVSDLGSSVAAYYTAAAESFPLATVGYRF
jgi:hypothetical protein